MKATTSDPAFSCLAFPNIPFQRFLLVTFYARAVTSSTINNMRGRFLLLWCSLVMAAMVQGYSRHAISRIALLVMPHCRTQQPKTWTALHPNVELPTMNKQSAVFGDVCEVMTCNKKHSCSIWLPLNERTSCFLNII